MFRINIARTTVNSILKAQPTLHRSRDRNPPSWTDVGSRATHMTSFSRHSDPARSSSTGRMNAARLPNHRRRLRQHRHSRRLRSSRRRLRGGRCSRFHPTPLCRQQKRKPQTLAPFAHVHARAPGPCRAHARGLWLLLRFGLRRQPRKVSSAK